jgi:hypothetical protein
MNPTVFDPILRHMNSKLEESNARLEDHMEDIELLLEYDTEPETLPEPHIQMWADPVAKISQDEEERDNKEKERRERHKKRKAAGLKGTATRKNNKRIKEAEKTAREQKEAMEKMVKARAALRIVSSGTKAGLRHRNLDYRDALPSNVLAKIREYANWYEHGRKLEFAASFEQINVFTAKQAGRRAVMNVFIHTGDPDVSFFDWDRKRKTLWQPCIHFVPTTVAYTNRLDWAVREHWSKLSEEDRKKAVGKHLPLIQNAHYGSIPEVKCALNKSLQ